MGIAKPEDEVYGATKGHLASMWQWSTSGVGVWEYGSGEEHSSRMPEALSSVPSTREQDSPKRCRLLREY